MATLTGEALQLRAQQALAVPLAAALGVSLLDEDDPTAGVAFTVATLADNGAGGTHAAALAAVLELLLCERRAAEGGHQRRDHCDHQPRTPIHAEPPAALQPDV
jgi:hypothetical protein